LPDARFAVQGGHPPRPAASSVVAESREHHERPVHRGRGRAGRDDRLRPGHVGRGRRRHLARIDEVNPAVNAVTVTLADEARAAADSRLPGKQRYGRKRGTFEPRPPSQRRSVDLLAGRAARAGTPGAESDPVARRGCSWLIKVLTDSGGPLTRAGDPRGRRGTRARVAFLEHREGLLAQERSPIREPDRTGGSRPLPQSPRIDVT